MTLPHSLVVLDLRGETYAAHRWLPFDHEPRGAFLRRLIRTGISRMLQIRWTSSRWTQPSATSTFATSLRHCFRAPFERGSLLGQRCPPPLYRHRVLRHGIRTRSRTRGRPSPQSSRS
ncbi:hypothetical protein ACVOMV_27485 (plasmid) [Mesorhizobium atlanticum]|uniref:hypothetical protein n=1 Tax=Mesorhizobium atlanticum TaxID=2233532 RepID=UPI0037042986